MHQRMGRTFVVLMLILMACGSADTGGRRLPGSNRRVLPPGGATGSGIGAVPGAGIGPGGTACSESIPATSQLPRLTRVQYDNTVRDLLGIEGQPSSMLAPDSPGSVDQRAWDGYRSAAESLATQVMSNPSA